MLVRPENIGGGVVRRHFTMAGRSVFPPMSLTREQLLALPTSNRQALIDNHYIEVYPPRPADPADPEGERFIIGHGVGANRTYDVIEGRKLNSEPLTKEQAEALVADGEGGDGKPPIEEPPQRN